VDRRQFERLVSAARLRALALVPYSPAWDAAMGDIEDLERALWRLEAVPYGEDRTDRAVPSREAIPA
jgi:hypothetical protein